MNVVDPIRDEKYIEIFKDHFKDNPRNHLLFMCGIYLGRRISDLLQLRVIDVKNKDYIYFKEKKTRKTAKVIINSDLKKIIKKYIQGKKGHEYLFRSRKGENEPIGRVQAYRIFKKAADEVVYVEKIGCHTLRKTFGYRLHENGVSIMVIADLLNHSDIQITKRYIGINQDTKDEAIKNLSF